jgi:DNA-directed RNA polymerase specialized sigma24 family protein
VRNDPFPGLGRAALDARIADARLSETDAKIARMRLLDDMDYADIAAAVHYSRSTVSRRLNRIIAKI